MSLSKMQNVCFLFVSVGGFNNCGLHARARRHVRADLDSSFGASTPLNF